jgi:hypothetical protein
LRVARQRDESEMKLNEVAKLFMRRPSRADAEHAEDAGEFHGTPTYAPSSSRRLRATRVSANREAKVRRAEENLRPAERGEGYWPAVPLNSSA